MLSDEIKIPQTHCYWKQRNKKKEKHFRTLNASHPRAERNSIAWRLESREGRKIHSRDWMKKTLLDLNQRESGNKRMDRVSPLDFGKDCDDCDGDHLERKRGEMHCHCCCCCPCFQTKGSLEECISQRSSHQSWMMNEGESLQMVMM